MARREDGSIELGFHRPWSDGTTHVVFTPRVLLERLAAIVPHPRVHLVHYHGVLAPAATWRPRVVPTPVNDDGTVKTWKSETVAHPILRPTNFRTLPTATSRRDGRRVRA